MRKEAQSYLAMVKAAESVPRLGILEKQAMWNGFYSEIQKIAEEGAARSMAEGFSKKLAYSKHAGVIAETIGAVGGLALTEKAINKFHPHIGEGAHLAALTAGAIGGTLVMDKLFHKKEVPPRPGTPGSPEYTAGKEDHSGMGLLAASWYLQRSQSGLPKAASALVTEAMEDLGYRRFKSKQAAIAPWVAQPLMHAAGGAVLGAGINAARAKPGERGKAALKGAAYGAAGGAAAGHVIKRTIRGIDAHRQAARAYGYPDIRAAVKSPERASIYAHGEALKSQMPIYPGKVQTASVKLAKKRKDDPYDRAGDSVWDKHKGKILAGLATATAVGVGAKLLHNRHKHGKTPTAPPSSAPSTLFTQAAKSGPPKKRMPRAKPRQRQEHMPFSRGRTWEAGRERTWNPYDEEGYSR